MFEVACKLFELLWFWPRRKKKETTTRRSPQLRARCSLKEVYIGFLLDSPKQPKKDLYPVKSRSWFLMSIFFFWMGDSRLILGERREETWWETRTEEAKEGHWHRVIVIRFGDRCILFPARKRNPKDVLSSRRIDSSDHSANALNLYARSLQQMRVTLDGLLWSPRMSRGQSLQRMLTWPLASGLTAESDLRPEWSWIALNTCRLELQNLEWRRLWGKKTSESWRCGFVRSFDDFELARFQGAYGFRGTNWSIGIRRSSIAMWTASLCSQQMRSCNFVS